MELNTEIKWGEDTKDEDLVTTIEDWITESTSYHDYLLSKQKVAEEYYCGNQTARGELEDTDCDTVENRIFEGVETLVPIATSAAHNFCVLPGGNTEGSAIRAEKHQKVMDTIYRTQFVQKKLEETTRHLLLYRFGVMEWCWNYVKDDIEIKVIDPRLVLVPKLRCDPHELPYKIVLEEYTPEEIQDYFPEFKDFNEISTWQSKLDKGGEHVESKKTFQVFKVMTADYYVWYCNGKILRKEQNPYYNFTEPTQNFFDQPRDSLVFFSTFNVGDEPFGSISLVEAVIDIQDEINVQKRQIIQNLKMMGNGQIVMDKSAMTKEEADAITNEAGLIIQGIDIVSGNKYKREPAMPLPQAHFSNLIDSKTAFDNIFGLHSATRGSAASKTLGQDILSRQQDLTRIDLITRVLNRGVQRLAEGVTQLQKLFYTEPHVFKYLGAEGAVEYISLTNADIEAGTEIVVKSGRSPEYDRQQLGTVAIQLWQLGALGAGDLYRMLELPNPEQLEQNLIAWKTGQLSQQTQAEIMKTMAGASAKSAMQPQEGVAGQGRGVETPQNVLQRARQELGGTAPVGGTPKMANQ